MLRFLPFVLVTSCLSGCSSATAEGAVAAEPDPAVVDVTPTPPASASASAPGRTLDFVIANGAIRCSEDRCEGTVSSRAEVVFTLIDPAAKARWAEQPERPLVPQNGKIQRWELAQPNLDDVFITKRPDELLLDGSSVASSTNVPLRLTFPDGVVVRGEVPITAVGLQLAFLGRMREAARGPVALPGDDSHTGAPRAMFAEFSKTIYGSAKRVSEIDWVLLFDDAPRQITCQRMGNARVEEQKFNVNDVRGRVYERRSGKLVGEKILPDGRELSCDTHFALHDQNAGMIGIRDLGAQRTITDWAWGELRKGKP